MKLINEKNALNEENEVGGIAACILACGGLCIIDPVGAIVWGMAATAL